MEHNMNPHGLWQRFRVLGAVLVVASILLATPSARLDAAPRPATILALRAGSGAGQVGVTGIAGPSTFRVGADGTIRIMDTVNRRLLFLAGASGKLQRTINLSTLQRPTDFVVTGQGAVYVLDAGTWTVAQFTLDGRKPRSLQLNPALKGRFSTLSLLADGRLAGLGAGQGYVLMFANGMPMPLEDQPRATVAGTVTVRSNANFILAPDRENAKRRRLSIQGAGVSLMDLNLGELGGPATFLDVNQCMEPYVAVTHGAQSEIRRYTVRGELMGTLTVDTRSTRRVLRPIYVDRPGTIFTMTVTATGVRIQRYTMTNAAGAPLPMCNQLVTTTPWSPGALQSGVG
jgi:hypothetical protein